MGNSCVAPRSKVDWPKFKIREMSLKTYLVTGGAGFIGSHFVEKLVRAGERVVVLDLLTYAGHRKNLSELETRIQFVQGDICDSSLTSEVLNEFKVDSVVNFAAESHVDRSIADAGAFLKTNVMGVYSLLKASLDYWSKLTAERRSEFLFLQVSTDEVYGALGEDGKFKETTPYAPNSPYSASKASGDHLARAWFHTYGLPTITTNCSNNYGPRQFPEKLIPHMINCALSGKPLPVYGNGKNVRDWIHVLDHCEGVQLALLKGKPGSTYCFGGNSERRNIDVVRAICAELDRQSPRSDGRPHADGIKFVEDRKGHDWRYAIDDSKAVAELGFTRTFESFEQGLADTVKWYLNNQEWIQSVMEKNK